jgi:YVTN family beta-propeller protein
MGNALSKITEWFAAIVEVGLTAILLWSIAKGCLKVRDYVCCLFANKETIEGAVKQGKEVIDVASQHAPTAWGGIKQYVTEVRMEVAYVISRDDTKQKGYVLVIDVKTRKCIRQIEVGSFPSGIAITQDRRRVYVVNRDNKVSVIDTEKNQVITTVKLGFGAKPEKIAITPNGERIYVTRPGNCTVAVFARKEPLIGIEEYELMTTLRVGEDPKDLAVTADGREVYVVNSGDRTVTVIDVGNNTITATIPLQDQPQRVYVTPNENTWVYTLNANSVTIINPETKQPRTILDNIHPERAVFNQRGNHLYLTVSVANDGLANRNHKVLIINVGIYDYGYIREEIVLERRPKGIVVSSDEKWICVENAGNQGATRIDPVIEQETAEEIGNESDPLLASDISMKKIPKRSPNLLKEKWEVSVVPKINNAVNSTQGGSSSSSSSHQAIPNQEDTNEAAITLDGEMALVTNSATNQCLYIDRGDKQGNVDAKPVPSGTPSKVMIARIGVGAGPDSLAVTPDQSKVYVANWLNDTVSVIDPRSNNVIATISAGKGPRNVTITPNGGQAWVSNQFNRSISVIDTVTNQVIATIFVEEEPGKIVFTVDGAKACIVNYGSGTVMVIETKTFEIKATFDVGSFPEDIAINLASDEQWTYVASRGNRSLTLNAAIDPGNGRLREARVPNFTIFKKRIRLTFQIKKRSDDNLTTLI